MPQILTSFAIERDTWYIATTTSIDNSLDMYILCEWICIFVQKRMKRSNKWLFVIPDRLSIKIYVYIGEAFVSDRFVLAFTV